MSVVLKARPTVWRRSLRFSSLALNILVPVAGAWLGWIVGNAHAQNTAVAAIEGSGGAIVYSHKNPWLNTLMSNLLGIDYPRTVSHVFLRANGSNADLIHLKSFDHLKFLSLERSNVDDFGLEHLNGLASLEHLILAGTKVTDAGLAHVKTLYESPGCGWRFCPCFELSLDASTRCGWRFGRRSSLWPLKM
jgi:hypothetical protein